MTTTKAILNQVKSTLAADPTLSTNYMKQFYLGMRANIPEQDFPLVMLDVMAVNEAYPNFPTVDGHFLMLVAAYTRVFDADAQLIGDANYKGVLDLENDVKLAFGLQYPTLGLTGLMEFTFPKTEFVVRDDMAKFPVRGVLIQVDLHYRTRLDTRT